MSKPNQRKSPPSSEDDQSIAEEFGIDPAGVFAHLGPAALDREQMSIQGVIGQRTHDSRNRGTDRTDDSDELRTDRIEEPMSTSPLRADTLQATVLMALAYRKSSKEDDCFVFARAIRAFEVRHNRRLPEDELVSAFAEWWRTIKTQLPPDTDFEETWLLFRAAYDKVKQPMGANVLAQAQTLMANTKTPTHYTNTKLQKLAHLCWAMQECVGEIPFFLSARTTAQLIECKSPETASAFLAALVRDRVLVLVERGVGHRASRYRYNAKAKP